MSLVKTKLLNYIYIKFFYTIFIPIEKIFVIINMSIFIIIILEWIIEILKY